MLLLTILSTATLALTANAFLIPLEIANKAFDQKPVGSLTIPLDCSTCPFAIDSTRNGAHEWTTGIKSDLLMNFTITDKEISLNGVPLYPSIVNMGPPKALSAKQVPKENDVSIMDERKVEAYHKELSLSYSLEINGNAGNGGDFIELEVLAIDGQMVNIDGIKMHVVKDQSGLLTSKPLIMTVPPSPFAPGAQCPNVFCRIMSILKAKMQAARTHATNAAKKIKGGCMRKFGVRPHGDRPHHKGPIVKGGAPKFANMPHLHHGHVHHRHGMHKVLHVVNRIFAHVVLPVLVGVAAGMAASAVGMLVGQVVCLLWMRYRRSTQGGYTRVQLEEAESDEDLPRYEELEGESIVVDEKKEPIV